MNTADKLRIALLLPTVELGAYWQPVLKHLSQLSSETILYTGRPWRGFNPEDYNNVNVTVVGKTKRVVSATDKGDYGGGFMMLSPKIIDYLFKFRPNVIIASGFSVWTLLALLLRPFGKWRVILAWEGSSPNVDFRHSQVRSLTRRWIAQLADSIITNSIGGQEYLVNFLGIEADKVTANPYMVPDSKTLSLQSKRETKDIVGILKSPVFLYVGRIEQRKGLHLLLQACNLLNKNTTQEFTLLIIGDGPERAQLENFSIQSGLEGQINWLGWVDYDSLGSYFEIVDVFIFPTLEDTWGMVVLEAMVFGLPILCSKWAGASEMIIEEENGYIFDPHIPQELAKFMQSFIDDPNLAFRMGQRSLQVIMPHTPEAAAQFFLKAAVEATNSTH